ncbi:MAG TPA: hypothetical protein VFO85_00725 [Vicinamibacteria bacterium]|nr:hypothetical protein [Vicinamibacteria bacterium]
MRAPSAAVPLITLLALALPMPVSAKDKADGLRGDMRKLWEDHITWTRQFIVSALADLPDKAAATERLLKNQVDIGNAVKPFYGEAAGDKLSGLLKEHILIAADIVGAAKAGQTAKVESSKTRWVANADEISAFLSGANPKHWPAAEMKAMMRDHLDLTTAELMARLNKDWAADVAAYEKVHAQALHMADMLTDGIARQFPEKLK